MKTAVLQGFAALALACLFIVVSLMRYRSCGALGFALQLVGLCCFVVVAIAHIFEALAIFPELGWGQTNSPGHYLNLTAALLGVVLIFASLLVK